MPTLYKSINIDLSKIKNVPLNFKLAADCPACSTEVVKNFKKHGLTQPIEKQLLKIDMACPACSHIFKVPARIMNIRMVMAYDPEKTKDETS